MIELSPKKRTFTKQELAELRSKQTLAQYNQCAADFRYYDGAIWKMPSIAITLASVFLAGAYSLSLLEGIPRIVLLFSGGLLSLVLCAVLVKHRVFHDEIQGFLEETEDDWEGAGIVNRIICRETGRVDENRKKSEKLSQWQKIRAYNWLRNAMIIMTIVMFILASYELGIYLLKFLNLQSPYYVIDVLRNFLKLLASCHCTFFCV